MPDASIERELNFLGIDRASLGVLLLLPLVQVAWADGEIQDAEHTLILQLANENYNLTKDALDLLDGWLSHPPSPKYIERGRRLLLALAYTESGLKINEETLSDVVEFTKSVARAAGGFLGFRSVGKDEAIVLDEIAAALNVVGDAVSPELFEVEEDVEDDATDVHSAEEMGKIREAANIAAPAARTVAENEALADLIHHGAQGGVNFEIDKEGVTIGRSRANDVQIPHDAKLSRFHCKIIVEQGRLYLVDNGTTNGTLVNGLRITRRPLFGGEQITAGNANFTLLLR